MTAHWRIDPPHDIDEWCDECAVPSGPISADQAEAIHRTFDDPSFYGEEMDGFNMTERNSDGTVAEP